MRCSYGIVSGAAVAALAATLAGCGAGVTAQQSPATDLGASTPAPGEDGAPGRSSGGTAVGGTGGEGGKGADGGAADRGASWEAAPAGMRYVGYGHAAVAVPTKWAVNASKCGTPVRDTVEMNMGAIPACGHPRPKGVESVGIWRLEPGATTTTGELVDVDGVATRRTATTCAKDPFDGARTCHGSVTVLPEGIGAGVVVGAQSSTGAAEVDRMLAHVRVFSDRVGVPGFWELEDGDGRAEQSAYVLLAPPPLLRSAAPPVRRSGPGQPPTGPTVITPSRGPPAAVTDPSGNGSVVRRSGEPDGAYVR